VKRAKPWTGLRGEWPVDQIQVDVVATQQLEAVLERPAGRLAILIGVRDVVA